MATNETSGGGTATTAYTALQRKEVMELAQVQLKKALAYIVDKDDDPVEVTFHDREGGHYDIMIAGEWLVSTDDCTGELDGWEQPYPDDGMPLLFYRVLSFQDREQLALFSVLSATAMTSLGGHVARYLLETHDSIHAPFREDDFPYRFAPRGEVRQRAKDLYESDDVQFDDDAEVSWVETGVWVQGWVFVAK